MKVRLQQNGTEDSQEANSYWCESCTEKKTSVERENEMKKERENKAQNEVQENE